MNVSKSLVILTLLFNCKYALCAYPSTHPRGVTADSQVKATEENTETTRRLRARLMADDQLSTQAHNIQIITVADAITLKGNVHNKAEKVHIENLARSMAGDKKVYNQLTYKK